MNVVRAVQPTEVIVENVPQAEKYANAINQEFWDAGYTTSWARAKAHEVGLPHRRDRVFIYAHKLGRPEHTDANAPTYTPTTPTFPTPTVVDMGWGRTTNEWNTWLQAQKTKHNNGNGHGRSLYQMCHEGTLLVMEHLMGLPPATSQTNPSATQPNAASSATESPPPARPPRHLPSLETAHSNTSPPSHDEEPTT